MPSKQAPMTTIGKVGIGGTYENEASKIMANFGMNAGGYKFILDGVEKGKEDIIDANHESVLLILEGLGPRSCYKRFKVDDTISRWWSNSGNYADGLRCKCKENIKLAGFSTFATNGGEMYEIKFAIEVDG